MVTSLAMDGYNFFKNEPVDAPILRPQSIKELDVRQSILERFFIYPVRSLSPNFPKRPGSPSKWPRNCLASYARNCIARLRE